MPVQLRGRLGTGRPIGHDRPGSSQPSAGNRAPSVLGSGPTPQPFQLDPQHVANLSRHYEQEGFDGILAAQNGYSADVWSLSAWALAATQRIQLVASHRPGLQAPTLAARTLASLDQLSGGRVSVHIIQGSTDAAQQRDGDFLDKEARYRRSAEYLEIFHKELTAREPFDFQGEFYQVRGAFSEVKPLQSPRPFITSAGASDAGIELAARYTDGYAFFPEPLADTIALLDRVRARASAYGRTLKFWRDANFILAETDEAAREKAESETRRFQQSLDGQSQPPKDSTGWQRLHDLASRGDWHDRALYTGLWRYNAGGPPFVGSPQTAADALLDYYDLGIEIFSIGFHGDPDPKLELQRELLRLIRQGVEQRDRQKAQAK